MSNPVQARKIAEIASKIGTQPRWLDALINFETGGSYSTTAQNPYSSAKGLIQIIDSSAREIGYRDSTDAVQSNLDFRDQMDNVVLPYFERWMKQFGALNTQQKLYMTVFYPKAVDWPPNKEFPLSVQKVNPGIKTPQDYINFVNARVKEENMHFSKGMPLVAIALLGLGAWFWLKRRGR